MSVSKIIPINNISFIKIMVSVALIILVHRRLKGVRVPIKHRHVYVFSRGELVARICETLIKLAAMHKMNCDKLKTMFY